MTSPEENHAQLFSLADEYDIALNELHTFVSDVSTVLTDLGVEELNWFPPEELFRIILRFGLDSDSTHLLHTNDEEIGSPEHMALLTMEEYIAHRFSRQIRRTVEDEIPVEQTKVIDVISSDSPNGFTLLLARFRGADKITYAEMILANAQGVQRSLSLHSPSGQETLVRSDHPSYHQPIVDAQAHKQAILANHPNAHFLFITQASGLNPMVRR